MRNHSEFIDPCLPAGVQHREAAAGGVGEEEDQAGLRAQTEADGRPQEDVSTHTHTCVFSRSTPRISDEI